jgi:hypothetical protein
MNKPWPLHPAARALTEDEVFAAACYSVRAADAAMRLTGGNRWEACYYSAVDAVACLWHGEPGKVLSIARRAYHSTVVAA